MDTIAVSLSKISKAYQTGTYAPQVLVRKLLNLKRDSSNSYPALWDITLKIKSGDSVGVVGLNGSGKSTLLQLLAGTLEPTSGELTIKGRVAAILELGSGFNTNFTGIENVFLNGKLFGFNSDEIQAILPKILSFAGIGEYAELPVSTYSSGMIVRLAYSIISQLKPDILLVDEALAVGDFLFQQKCIRSMKNLQERGCTIIFVSHALNLMTEFCNRILFLDKGHIKFFGPVKEGMHVYESYLLESKERENEKLINIPPDASKQKPSVISEECKGVSLVSCEMVDTKGRKKFVFQSEEEIKLRVKLFFKKEFKDPHCGFKVIDENGKIAFGANSYGLKHSHGEVKIGQTIQFEFSIMQKFANGKYSLTIGLVNSGHGFPHSFFDETIFYLDDVIIFNILHDPNFGYWSGPVRLNIKCSSSHENN